MDDLYRQFAKDLSKDSHKIGEIWMAKEGRNEDLMRFKHL